MKMVSAFGVDGFRGRSANNIISPDVTFPALAGVG
jgi:hypothetical protein